MESEVLNREAKMKQAKEDSFRRFMEKSETKLLLSMIPPSEHPEAVETFARSAYESGHGSGQAEVMVMMLESMFKDKPRRD